MSWVATAIVGSSVLQAYTANQAAGAQADAARSAAGEQARQFDLIRSDTAPYREAGVAALNQLASIYGLNPTTNPELTTLQNQLAQTPQQIQTGTTQQVVGTDGSRADVYGDVPVYGANPEYTALQDRIAALPTQTQAAPDYSAFFQSPDYQFRLGEGQRAIDRSLASRGRALSGAGVRAGVNYASSLASGEFGNYFNRLAGIAGIGQAGVNTSANAGLQTGANTGNALMAAGNARASGYQGIGDAFQGGVSNAMLYNYLNPTQGGRLAVGGFQFNPNPYSR